MDENLLKVLRGQESLVRTALSKTMALEMLCGIMLAEIASTKPDPKAHMSAQSARILGFIEQFADVSDSSLVESFETVLRYAEKLVAGPSDGPRQAV